jgi:hypothetical protein
VSRRVRLRPYKTYAELWTLKKEIQNSFKQTNEHPQTTCWTLYAINEQSDVTNTMENTGHNGEFMLNK